MAIRQSRNSGFMSRHIHINTHTATEKQTRTVPGRPIPRGRARMERTRHHVTTQTVQELPEKKRATIFFLHRKQQRMRDEYEKKSRYKSQLKIQKLKVKTQKCIGVRKTYRSFCVHFVRRRLFVLTSESVSERNSIPLAISSLLSSVALLMVPLCTRAMRLSKSMWG